MNFDLTEDQEVLRDGVRRFVAERYSFEARRLRPIPSQTDRALWTACGEMGWLALTAPDSAGGLGWSMVDAAILMIELGKGLVDVPVATAALVAARLLDGVGSGPAVPVLEALVTGDLLVALALDEPDMRGAVALPKATARTDIDGIRLSGRKILVRGGDVADRLLVSATLEGAPALFLLDPAALRLPRPSYRLLDGSFAVDVDFIDALVPMETLIAGGNRASLLMDRAADEAALLGAAEAIGCMDRIIDLTAEHLRTRRQFSQRLADFQVLQHRMADLFVETEMARSALYRALGDIDADPIRRAASVSAARVRIDQAAGQVGNQGIHLHGGMGMSMELPVGHLYRRLLMLARTHGDTDHHLNRYERIALDA